MANGLLAVAQMTSITAEGLRQDAGADELPIQILASGVLSGHQAGILSIAMSPDGKLLSSGGGQFSTTLDPPPGEIMLWDNG